MQQEDNLELLLNNDLPSRTNTYQHMIFILDRRLCAKALLQRGGSLQISKPYVQNPEVIK